MKKTSAIRYSRLTNTIMNRFPELGDLETLLSDHVGMFAFPCQAVFQIYRDKVILMNHTKTGLMICVHVIDPTHDLFNSMLWDAREQIRFNISEGGYASLIVS